MSDSKQTMAPLGDIIMTRSVSLYREPEYLRMREILRGLDVVFANFESCVHPYLEDHTSKAKVVAAMSRWSLIS